MLTAAVDWRRTGDPPVDLNYYEAERVALLNEGERIVYDDALLALEKARRNKITGLYGDLELRPTVTARVAARLSDPAIQALLTRRTTPGRLSAESAAPGALYVIKVDANYLGAANELGSHEAGDGVLVDLARAVTGCARDSMSVMSTWTDVSDFENYFVHEHGDEFGGLVVGPRAIVERTYHWAHEVLETRMLLPDVPIPRALSFGAASLHEAAYIHAEIVRRDQALRCKTERALITRLMQIMASLAAMRMKQLKRHDRVLLMLDLMTKSPALFDRVNEYIRKGAGFVPEELLVTIAKQDPDTWGLETFQHQQRHTMMDRDKKAATAAALRGMAERPDSNNLDPRIQVAIIEASQYAGVFSFEKLYIKH